MSEKEIIGIRQQLDQLGEMMADLAPMLHKFFDGLVESGFTEAQAMMLLQNYMDATFGKTK